LRLQGDPPNGGDERFDILSIASRSLDECTQAHARSHDRHDESLAALRAFSTASVVDVWLAIRGNVLNAPVCVDHLGSCSLTHRVGTRIPSIDEKRKYERISHESARPGEKKPTHLAGH
jgi:hypothetical protein